MGKHCTALMELTGRVYASPGNYQLPKDKVKLVAWQQAKQAMEAAQASEIHQTEE